MQTLPGYRRDFPPELIHKLSSEKNISIVLEHGYGADLGYKEKEYYHVNVSFKDRLSVFSQSNIVVILTAPSESEIRVMKKGSTLVSMLHYPTHPERNSLMKKLQLNAISLDSLEDFENRRMVQDLKNTAWNGITEGFKQLRKKMGEKLWFQPRRKPITVMLIGFGEVGKNASEAALKMGKTDFINELMSKEGNAQVNVIPISRIHTETNSYISFIDSRPIGNGGSPHMIVDATQRKDNTKTIVPKKVIGLLPPECIIVDLTADKYESSGVVKGIEGIPTGSEKKFVFEPNDEAWEDKNEIPSEYQLPEKLRRTVVSHYAWPSYGDVQNRIENMKKYSIQIYPVLKTLINNKKTPAKKSFSQNLWDIEEAIKNASLQSFK